MSASRNTNNSLNQNIPNNTLKHMVTFSENPKPKPQKLNKSYENPLPDNLHKVMESIQIKSPLNNTNGRRTDMGFRSIDHNKSQFVKPSQLPLNNLIDQEDAINLTYDYSPQMMGYSNAQMFHPKMMSFSPQTVAQYQSVINWKKNNKKFSTPKHIPSFKQQLKPYKVMHISNNTQVKMEK